MSSEEKSLRDAVKELQQISDSKRKVVEETEAKEKAVTVEKSLNQICYEYIEVLELIRRDAKMLIKKLRER